MKPFGKDLGKAGDGETSEDFDAGGVCAGSVRC
jgi:hypothetical protein